MVIIHFLPIEKYPPVLNLLNYINEQLKQSKITVVTTQNKDNISLYKAKNVKIIRFHSIDVLSRFRYFHYLNFYIGVIFRLFMINPSKIIWYETLSSFPAIVYYKLCRKRPKLFIHYHEYMSPEEINQGMVLVRWFHLLEKHIYPKVDWISHTNEPRMQLFLKDNSSVKIETTHIMPNYPPKWWYGYVKKGNQVSFPIKLIYVGSFASFETIYIKELINWLSKYQNELILDIYSFTVPDEIKKYCSNLSNVHFNNPIDYNVIPSIIHQYDIGLILYKAVIDNVKYCASNKLFEYLACGLDVWYPDVMIGTNPYIKTDTYPKVLPLDFENFDKINFHELISKEGLKYSPVNYCAEDALEDLVNCIVSV